MLDLQNMRRTNISEILTRSMPILWIIFVWMSKERGGLSCKIVYQSFRRITEYLTRGTISGRWGSKWLSNEGTGREGGKKGSRCLRFNKLGEGWSGAQPQPRDQLFREWREVLTIPASKSHTTEILVLVSACLLSEKSSRTILSNAYPKKVHAFTYHVSRRYLITKLYHLIFSALLWAK